MESILTAILRQMLICNQMKLVELARDDSKRKNMIDEIKIWNDAIKFDLDVLSDSTRSRFIKTIEEIGGSDNV